MSGERHLAVLDWSSRPHHLMRRLRPDAPTVRVLPGMAGEALLDALLVDGAAPGAVLVHIDASQPHALIKGYDRLCEALGTLGCTVWNGGVSDLRKRSLQSMLAAIGLPTVAAAAEGPADEPLIVKTNLNSRGIAEWEMADEERDAIGLGPRRASPLDGRSYPVMTRAEVPAEWWSDTDLAIERYVDNRDGRFSRFYVAGENYVLCTGRSAATVRRMADAADRYDYLLDRINAVDPRLDELLPPGAVAAALAALAVVLASGLDYGAVDLVQDDDGVPYVVDVNLTPYWGDVGGEDSKMLEHLRAGLP